jgi:hypothetical protein
MSSSARLWQGHCFFYFAPNERQRHSLTDVPHVRQEIAPNAGAVHESRQRDDDLETPVCSSACSPSLASALLTPYASKRPQCRARGPRCSAQGFAAYFDRAHEDKALHVSGYGRRGELHRRSCVCSVGTGGAYPHAFARDGHMGRDVHDAVDIVQQRAGVVLPVRPPTMSAPDVPGGPAHSIDIFNPAQPRESGATNASVGAVQRHHQAVPRHA